jgi:hypothetical protein
MNIYKQIFFSFLLSTFSSISFADNKNDLAMEYLELTKTKQLFDVTIDNYVNHLSARNSQLNKDELKLFFNTYMGWEVLKNPTIKIVSEKFTDSELKNINAFFKTESGQALAEKSPIISMEISNLIGGNINKALSVIRDQAQSQSGVQ